MGGYIKWNFEWDAKDWVSFFDNIKRERETDKREKESDILFVIVFVCHVLQFLLWWLILLYYYICSFFHPCNKYMYIYTDRTANSYILP